MQTALPRTDRPTPLPLRNLLANYTTSHPLRSPSPLPSTSRMDPKLTQRVAPPFSSPFLWTIPVWIAFVRFALAKGIHIIWSLLSHFLFGPKRKSWGYRMTFIVSFMRNVSQHSSLADIILIRRLISFHQLIPLPADAVVTPITFTVPLRSGERLARGFLRELDSKETGERELTGEWVVGVDVWKRLKAERRSKMDLERKRKKQLSPLITEAVNTGGRDSPDVDSDAESSSTARKGFVGERVIYYVHGGAYYVGNAATHRLVTIGVSKACNARVFAINYRLAPEHPFPLPLHDVLHGYLRLLAPPLSIPPENIVVMGDSAGGGLCLALAMYLRDEGYKMPAGLVVMSPWVDLTMSCGSWDENADSDVVPMPDPDDHLNPVGCYLGPGIQTYLTHPYASPLFGDLSDLPPMLIQSGDSEVLRDEVTLLAHKATLSDIPVTHELYEDMVHVFQMFPFLAAAEAAINSIGRWVRVTLPKIEESRSSYEPGGLGLQGVAEEMDSDARNVGNSALSQGIRDVFSGAASTAGETNIDVDSLPASGSPTPTTSRARSPATSTQSSGNLPRLRRAQTTSVVTSGDHSPISSPIIPPTTTRKRRPTASNHPNTHPAFHLADHSSPSSPGHKSSGGSSYFPSNPTSPTPSLRRRMRATTISSAVPPRTRHRSKSHTDIHQLVEGYVEGGPANETTVYGAGGEIRSVGVLGEDEE